jgi:elongator complex protein 4
LQTLLSPSYKHSTLLGLGAGSTGQNNLSFRLKRKRFVIETLHLGVEGGVGERRTEPPSTMKSLSAGGSQTSHTHSSGCSHGSGDIEGVVGGFERLDPGESIAEPASTAKAGARFAVMNIAVEDGSDGPATPAQSEEASRPKKERRKVAFMQDDKPELYEF